MRVLVFVDHNIICRHFLMSGVLGPLSREAELRFVFPDDGGRRVTLDPDTLALPAPWERLPIDAQRQLFWRWRLYQDQLKLRPGRHEAALRRIRWSALGWRAALALTVAGLPLFEPLFLRWLQKKIDARPNRKLDELLQRFRPDVIVHPSVLDGVFINDLVAAGRQRGVPVVVVMNSWDNPSTKRAVVGKPDWLLVWGAQTQGHASRFIGMARERVVAFGAAQFDAFRASPSVSRDALCRSYGFDPALPLVLFAGANTETDEFSTVTALDNAISAGDLPPVSVIYRPHPWGGGGANGQRLSDVPWLHVRIDHAMQAYVRRIVEGNPVAELPSYAEAHDLLSAIDVAVSPLSTMLVEAMLHGKEVICFLPEGDMGSNRMREAAPMLHFEEFLACPEVGQARSIGALLEQLKVAIGRASQPDRKKAMRAASERFVESFDRSWGERFVDFLRQRVLASLDAAGGR